MGLEVEGSGTRLRNLIKRLLVLVRDLSLERQRRCAPQVPSTFAETGLPWKATAGTIARQVPRLVCFNSLGLCRRD